MPLKDAVFTPSKVAARIPKHSTVDMLATEVRKTTEEIHSLDSFLSKHIPVKIGEVEIDFSSQMGQKKPIKFLSRRTLYLYRMCIKVKDKVYLVGSSKK